MRHASSKPGVVRLEFSTCSKTQFCSPPDWMSTMSLAQLLSEQQSKRIKTHKHTHNTHNMFQEMLFVFEVTRCTGNCTCPVTFTTKSSLLVHLENKNWSEALPSTGNSSTMFMLSMLSMFTSADVPKHTPAFLHSCNIIV